MRTFILSIIASALAVSSINAQSPTPIIVPAMTPATAKQNPVTAAVTTSAIQTTLKVLEAMKAANDEILSQQKATLEKLEEIEKAANDIRIYTKRG
jgi:beta-lactamase regulating signal transducer with metallopeptidase domain